MYRLKDYNGELIDGSFYEPKIQKVEVSKDKIYQVENILARHKKKGEVHVLVRWKNWPKKFYLWIPLAEKYINLLSGSHGHQYTMDRVPGKGFCVTLPTKVRGR